MQHEVRPIPVIVGIVLLDLALQALHVTNQQLIVAIDPSASSRLIGSNMVYFATGSGIGAIAATAVYSAFGWVAVCMLGAGFSALGLLIWGVDRARVSRSERQPTVTG